MSLCFETDSENEVSLIITGNTWNYRARQPKNMRTNEKTPNFMFRIISGHLGDDLEKAGVQGQRASEGGQYIRFMKGVDVSDPEQKQSILNLVEAGGHKMYLL